MTTQPEDKSYTKDELKKALIEIRKCGFVPSINSKNSGDVGRKLEDLLGIKENNLPLPNAAEWELKAQRLSTKVPTTLFHTEPSPTTMKLVVKRLLPFYGWAHKGAGTTHSIEEKSFRQTLNAVTRTDRGFKVVVDEEEKKLLISFDSKAVFARHKEWLESVEKLVGLGELETQPYWGFNDLFHKAGSKLHNCFYVQAETKKIDGLIHYHYTKITMLRELSRDKFFEHIRLGNVLVDFDARSGHNHGTKFRLKQPLFPTLYNYYEEI